MAYLKPEQDSAQYSFAAGTLCELADMVDEFTANVGENERYSVSVDHQSESLYAGGLSRPLRTAHRWTASVTVEAM